MAHYGNDIYGHKVFLYMYAPFCYKFESKVYVSYAVCCSAAIAMITWQQGRNNSNIHQIRLS